MHGCYQKIKFCCCVALLMTLVGCAILEQEQRSDEKASTQTKLQLSEYDKSDFRQVEVVFYTHQSKELVFRVLTDIEKTPLWFERVNQLEVLEAYNNHQYLLRTIISAPWPFKDRELITCVETQFEPLLTRILVSSCSDRVAVQADYLRLEKIQSSWEITTINERLVKVSYKTWLDPGGHVPAFIYNRELLANTQLDMDKLQDMINSSTLDQYPY